jgi:AIPR protein
MRKYELLLKVLDSLVREGQASDVAKRFRVSNDNPESENQARARAYIHLLLKVRFGMESFKEREHHVTDESDDGGIDAYFIDKQKKMVFFIQSKFRATARNFEEKEIAFEELLSMDIKRIVSGKAACESGKPYNHRIHRMQEEIRQLVDIASYHYAAIILANAPSLTQPQMSRLVENYPVEVINYEVCYADLLLPVLKGSEHRADDIHIPIDLTAKANASNIEYMIETEHEKCEIRLVYIATLEIAKIFSSFRNSLLENNPRAFLGMEARSLNSAIEFTMTGKRTNEFALLNNGLTILSKHTLLNEETGLENRAQLLVTNPQIINGGQTAYVLGSLLRKTKSYDIDSVFGGKELLVRVITPRGRLGDDVTHQQRQNLINAISDATNKQSFVSNSDRMANKDVYVQLQAEMFRLFGILLERKKGEFADARQKNLVDSADILERNLFFRLYHASRGELKEARDRKAFAHFADPEQFLSDGDSLERTYFAFLCYRRMAHGIMKGRHSERLRGTFAQIYATSNERPLSLDEFESVAVSAMAKLKPRWKNFLLWVQQTRGAEFHRKERDQVTGEIAIVFDWGGWLRRPKAVEEDVRFYFLSGDSHDVEHAGETEIDTLSTSDEST